MSDKLYDILKKIGGFYLPGLAALYAALSEAWHLPYAVPIAATLAALATFINKVLEAENKAYFTTHSIVENPTDTQEIE